MKEMLGHTLIALGLTIIILEIYFSNPRIIILIVSALLIIDGLLIVCTFKNK